MSDAGLATSGSGAALAPPQVAPVKPEWSFTPPYSERLTEFMSAGWGPSDRAQLGSPPPAELLRARRRMLRGQLAPSAVAVVAAGVPSTRNGDQQYAFRPHSDYVWLCGDQEAGGVLMLDPSDESADRLYVDVPLPRSDPRFYTDAHSSEVWVGPRPSLSDREAALGITVRPLAELGAALVAVHEAVVGGGSDPALAGVRGLPARDGLALATVLAELRMVKDDWEIGQLREAVERTVDGYAAVRAVLRGRSEIGEREIESAYAASARLLGNGPGFQTIVGGGSHATTLHWTRNDGQVRAGELLLLDAGTELPSLYTGDLTRTLPVGGRFSAAQARVYECVLAAEDAAFEALEPGAEFRAYHRAVERVLAHSLADLGVLPVSAEESLAPESGLHRRWTLCAPGHHLGLDVHDCGDAAESAYLGAPLRPGMVLTVEPGLYFQANDELVPAGLRGVGIRIEDDVLITDDGFELLSRRLPRRPDAVETWLQG